MLQPLLEGQVDNRDDLIETLKAENSRLKEQLQDRAWELAKLKDANTRAIGQLRRVLTPLHSALKSVFGEMDDLGVSDEAPGAVNQKTSAVWEAWKQRLPETARKCIDALLTHGELNTQQLAIATGLHRTTIPAGIFQLNKAGLINKNGGRFSLKKL